MPLHAERPIVRVEHSSMRTIETSKTENLFGLWSVFARCSPAMEDGKRYENMAWRLWSRETFCCQPDHIVPPHWAFDRQSSNSATDMPELSTSLGSDDSNLESAIITSRSYLSPCRFEQRRHDSTTSQARGRHLTPIGLEKVVNSIQEKKFIEPLSPLPPQLAAPIPFRDTAPRAASPPLTARCLPKSSTSTVGTNMGADAGSPPGGSETSTATTISQHSVVRGFELGNVSTSYRSSTSLNPTPILKTSFLTRPAASKVEPVKKKQPMFTLGGSSEEENSSSLEAYSRVQRSSLAANLRRPDPVRKTASLRNEAAARPIPDIPSESEEAIASDSESEEEFDESAIEDEDSEEEWEDDDEHEESGPSSVNERTMFQRVDSKPNLASHRSLLTTALNESDRALEMQHAAITSAPAIRRSRNNTPNGPSTGNSPQEDSGLMMRAQASRPKPIMMTGSTFLPPPMSPKTTRREMLRSELTGSLRQNLLWERQQKNATTNAVARRQQSAANLPALRRAMTTGDVQGLTNVHQAQMRPTAFRTETSNTSYSDYFDQGLQEYHQRGW